MKPGQKTFMDRKINSKICRKLPYHEILIDCKFLILQVYLTLQKVYRHLLYKIYGHSCILHHSSHLKRICCSPSKDNQNFYLHLGCIIKPILHHLLGLDRIKMHGLSCLMKGSHICLHLKIFLCIHYPIYLLKSIF